mmetsp:Transcript_51390/g.121766  ORF Transcript_51390/g.121766 Transcript_51390/m.121766 type:complete len:258 (-) Transcript_51390:2671-3444(-)
MEPVFPAEGADRAEPREDRRRVRDPGRGGGPHQDAPSHALLPGARALHVHAGPPRHQRRKPARRQVQLPRRPRAGGVDAEVPGLPHVRLQRRGPRQDLLAPRHDWRGLRGARRIWDQEDAPRNHCDHEGGLLRNGGRRVYAHCRHHSAELDPEQVREEGEVPLRQESHPPPPRSPHLLGELRGIPGDQVQHRQALWPRRRRLSYPRHEGDDRHGGRGGRRVDRHWDAPPRPPQRAGERDAQADGGHALRVHAGDGDG